MASLGATQLDLRAAHTSLGSVEANPPQHSEAHPGASAAGSASGDAVTQPTRGQAVPRFGLSSRLAALTRPTTVSISSSDSDASESDASANSRESGASKGDQPSAVADISTRMEAVTLLDPTPAAPMPAALEWRCVIDDMDDTQLRAVHERAVFKPALVARVALQWTSATRAELTLELTAPLDAHQLCVLVLRADWTPTCTTPAEWRRLAAACLADTGGGVVRLQKGAPARWSEPAEQKRRQLSEERRAHCKQIDAEATRLTHQRFLEQIRDLPDQEIPSSLQSWSQSEIIATLKFVPDGPTSPRDLNPAEVRRPSGFKEQVQTLLREQHPEISSNVFYGHLYHEIYTHAMEVRGAWLRQSRLDRTRSAVPLPWLERNAYALRVTELGAARLAHYAGMRQRSIEAANAAWATRDKPDGLRVFVRRQDGKTGFQRFLGSPGNQPLLEGTRWPADVKSPPPAGDPTMAEAPSDATCFCGFVGGLHVGPASHELLCGLVAYLTQPGRYDHMECGPSTRLHICLCSSYRSWSTDLQELHRRHGCFLCGQLFCFCSHATLSPPLPDLEPPPPCPHPQPPASYKSICLAMETTIASLVPASKREQERGRWGLYADSAPHEFTQCRTSSTSLCGLHILQAYFGLGYEYDRRRLLINFASSCGFMSIIEPLQLRLPEPGTPGGPALAPGTCAEHTVLIDRVFALLQVTERRLGSSVVNSVLTGWQLELVVVQSGTVDALISRLSSSDLFHLAEQLGDGKFGCHGFHSYPKRGKLQGVSAAPGHSPEQCDVRRQWACNSFGPTHKGASQSYHEASPTGRFVSRDLADYVQCAPWEALQLRYLSDPASVSTLCAEWAALDFFSEGRCVSVDGLAIGVGGIPGRASDARMHGADSQQSSADALFGPLGAASNFLPECYRLRSIAEQRWDVRRALMVQQLATRQHRDDPMPSTWGSLEQEAARIAALYLDEHYDLLPFCG